MASATSTPAATRGARNTRSSGRGMSTGPSPTRLSRLQEKDSLRSLNDRLANYIHRVQELESERASLLVQLEQSDECAGRELGNMRRLYEEELADVRSTLDGVAKEKARLQIEMGNLSDEYKKLHNKHQRNEGDLTSALTHWRNAESALKARDSEVSKLHSESLRQKKEVEELQAEVKYIEGQLGDAMKNLSEEIMQSTNLANQLQTAKEQLAFEKNLGEQNTEELRSRSESRLLELETIRRKEFESKLADSMHQLRQDHENQLLQYKQELDKTFSSKLQNAQQAAMDKTNAVSSTKDELENAKLRIETLSSQLQLYQNEKMCLERRVQDLERTLDKERDSWQERLGAKEQELLSLRRQMFTQLEDYERLLDTKVALDMEINAYRKMLEVEEQRLQLSPSPSQSAAVSRTHEERHKLRGRKRKQEGPTGSSPASKMGSLEREGESAPIRLSEVDEGGRFIRLQNHSHTEQQLGGWVVRRIYPDMGNISFEIPSPCVLAGGQTLTIWASGFEEEAHSDDLILEDHTSWGPATDAKILIFNPQQKSVERRVRIQDQSDLDFEQYVAHGEIQRQPKKKKKCCSVS